MINVNTSHGFYPSPPASGAKQCSCIGGGGGTSCGGGCSCGGSTSARAPRTHWAPALPPHVTGRGVRDVTPGRGPIRPISGEPVSLASGAPQPRETLSPVQGAQEPRPLFCTDGYREVTIDATLDGEDARCLARALVRANMRAPAPTVSTCPDCCGKDAVQVARDIAQQKEAFFAALASELGECSGGLSGSLRAAATAYGGTRAFAKSLASFLGSISQINQHCCGVAGDPENGLPCGGGRPNCPNYAGATCLTPHIFNTTPQAMSDTAGVLEGRRFVARFCTPIVYAVVPTPFPRL